MANKLLGIIILTALLCGCDATVQISAMNGGAPVGRATISAMDPAGSNITAQGATGVNGKLKVVLPYGDYKLKAEKDGYIPAEGFIHVDMFAAFFGAKADVPLIKKAVTTAAIGI